MSITMSFRCVSKLTIPSKPCRMDLSSLSYWSIELGRTTIGHLNILCKELEMVGGIV